MSDTKSENAVNQLLTDDAKVNALDFVAYLETNGITPKMGRNETFCYQNKTICSVYIKGADHIASPWLIWLSDIEGDEIGLIDIPVDENLKEFAWKHINTCAHFSSNGESCGCDKSPGRSVVVFGRKFNNVCHSTLSFENPNVESLALVKKLVELMKPGIINNTINVC